MTTLTVTEARSKLYKLVDETLNTHQPITITGKHGNAVLISEEDWRSLEETLYLPSTSGMRESIHKSIRYIGGMGVWTL